VTLRIASVGAGTTVQDVGRCGFAHLGVPRSGPVDPRAHGHANRLVGNDPSAAAFESAGGLVVEAVTPAVLACSATGSVTSLRAGERWSAPDDASRRWTYVAVRGGLDVGRVLGSSSHDTLSGLGPPALTTGDLVAIGEQPDGPLVVEVVPLRPPTRVVRVWTGPRAEWFDGQLGALTGRRWTIGARANRVGLRLEPQPFPWSPLGKRSRAEGSLPSEGLLDGAVQVTPSGEPIVMLADHPTTGGYPVIGVVDPDDLGDLAQLPAGATVRFVAAG
jgi:biotin-dependent carboxylase-like uncharacterized protein